MNLSCEAPRDCPWMLQERCTGQKGLKIGDVDARIEEKLCYTISDKARKIGNGVAEAIDFVHKNKIKKVVRTTYLSILFMVKYKRFGQNTCRSDGRYFYAIIHIK